jgi:DNA-directed RNA polymerase specialized sigma24 family protein
MAPRSEPDTGEETVRLLATLIRMQCDSQSEAIVELGRAGLGASRIAELLGTSAGTVGVALQRAKASGHKAKAEKR